MGGLAGTLVVGLLNPAGRVAQALEVLRARGCDLMCIPETHTTEHHPFPHPGGGHTVLEARQPRLWGGGVAAVARPGLPMAEWRSRPADGVLWVRLPGVLLGGHTLALAVCYHQPSMQRGGVAEAAEWYRHLRAEWTAALDAGMVPCICGDLNARVAALPDWEAWEAASPRHSADGTHNAYGALLLQFCKDMCARIVNGRAPGSTAGARTSVGVGAVGAAGSSRSVVDYFIVPAAFLPQVRELEVSAEPEVWDHCTLVLRLAAAARPAAPAHDTSSDPCLMRFPCPRDPERAEAAVAVLTASPAIPALTAAAERAGTAADVEAVAWGRCCMVALACLDAGLRPARARGPRHAQGRGAGSRGGLPRHVQERYDLPRLRAVERRAAQRQRYGSEHKRARSDLQRATRQAQRAWRVEEAVRLERQFLVQHDAAGFHRAWRGPQAGAPDYVLRHPDEVLEYFTQLLSEPQPTPPAAQTPEAEDSAQGAPRLLEPGRAMRPASRPPPEGRVAAPAGEPAVLGTAAALAAAAKAAAARALRGLPAERARQATPSPGLPAARTPPPPPADGTLEVEADAQGAPHLLEPGRAVRPASRPPPEGREAAPTGGPAVMGAATAAQLQRAALPAAQAAEVARLRAAMDQPFTAEEVAELAARTPLRKAVVGPLAPWLLKPARPYMAPLHSAEFNAWARTRLPYCDARSGVALLPKKSAPEQPSDLRGIAVGALLAKLYAAGLERRVSDHAEAAGVHADGQFGFRRRRSTEQAVLALRTTIEWYRLQRRRQPRRGRSGRQQRVELWAAFIDFKAAYDSVPRERLWAALRQLGYGGWWLRAVQSIYADVPMSLSAPGLEARVFRATRGLKQGCPLSPTLFSLYIADFEQRVLAAAAAGGQPEATAAAAAGSQPEAAAATTAAAGVAAAADSAVAGPAPGSSAPLDLPVLAGRVLPPLLYADDMALLATSAAGLQAQLRLLETYCAERGLTVNLVKTKVMLFAGADSEAEALQRVERARLTYGGGRLAAVPEFKYLGVVFHCCRPIGESAAPGRAGVGRFAAAMFEGRCQQLGLEATSLLLTLYRTFVDSTLSYGAAVWAPGLALQAARRSVVGSSRLSDPEKLHLSSLRYVLGLPHRTPNATVLAEAGQPPLHVTWLGRAARFWSSLLEAPEGSLIGTIVEASTQLAAEHSDAPAAQLPWAAQLQRALREVGVEFDPAERAPLQQAAVERAALQHHLQQVAAAAEQPGRSRLRHYFCAVRPSCLSPDGYGLPEYLREVRERWRRVALAELRTGVHWGAEERERLLGPVRRPAAQRECAHCAAQGQPGRAEDTSHILLDCLLYADVRPRFPTLFPPTASAHPEAAPPTLHEFLERPAEQLEQLAGFAAACRKRGRLAAGLPP